MDIELRDFIAAQLMSGKVFDFNSPAHRENIADKGEKENWVQVSAKEATKRRIDEAAKKAYTIADAMIKARETKPKKGRIIPKVNPSERSILHEGVD